MVAKEKTTKVRRVSATDKATQQDSPPSCGFYVERDALSTKIGDIP
jgi:hypothetical protein